MVPALFPVVLLQRSAVRHALLQPLRDVQRPARFRPAVMAVAVVLLQVDRFRLQFRVEDRKPTVPGPFALKHNGTRRQNIVKYLLCITSGRR